MQILTKEEVLEALCRSTSKWGMLIHISLGSLRDGLECETLDQADGTKLCRLRAAPYLNTEKHFDFIDQDGGIILFDTQKEMEQCYNQTAGDDRPALDNPYNGKDYVYALTCDPEGNLLTENT